ncbi:MAG: TRAP transporter large permease [Burkholderiaceae bacterium]
MAISTITISFLVALATLLFSVPVAVTLAAAGLIGGLVMIGAPMVQSLGSVVWGVQNENALTAIPLFILLGELLLRTGLADRMYGSLSAWVDRLPGGLMHTNIASCALFAATCGSSVATSATIGTVALPTMQERGYPIAPTLGSLAAGGTLGILIPPSVAMLVYGSITNNSVGKLFIAGIIPGILLSLMFMLWILVDSLRRNGLTRAEAPIPLAEKLRLSRHLVPPFLIFGVVMGSIYTGLATPTESAGLGVLMALVLAALSGTMRWQALNQAFRNTASLTGMIALIIAAAFILNVTLNALDVPQMLSRAVTSIGVTPTLFILMMIVFYVILGMFLEVLSMQVTTIPIVYPIAISLGIDPIWFGVFIVLMSEIALITPPVGMNLYVVQGVRTDGGPIGDVINGIWPYVVMLILFTLLLWFVPELVTWLPQKMMS